MRISVVIPVWNGERFLKQALMSVAVQTRPADEVLVVDDGSDDGSREIAERAGFQCVRKERSGTAGAVNLGISLCSGDALAFLDQDDEWTPEKLRLQEAALSSELGAVYGRVSSGGRVTQARLVGCLLVRRKEAAEAGPLDERFGAASCMEWISRIRARTAFLDEVVLIRRIHESNSSRGRSEDYLRAVRHMSRNR